MAQGRLDDAVERWLLAERRLGAGGVGAAAGDDFPWVAVPRQRAELVGGYSSQKALQGTG